jgi:hypothetical protein
MHVVADKPAADCMFATLMAGFPNRFALRIVVEKTNKSKVERLDPQLVS